MTSSEPLSSESKPEASSVVKSENRSQSLNYNSTYTPDIGSKTRILTTFLQTLVTPKPPALTTMGLVTPTPPPALTTMSPTTQETPLDTPELIPTVMEPLALLI